MFKQIKQRRGWSLALRLGVLIILLAAGVGLAAFGNPAMGSSDTPDVASDAANHTAYLRDGNAGLLLRDVTEPAAIPSALAVSVANKFSYQGRLSDAGGAALSGDYAMQFQLYDAEEDGALLWDGGEQTVAVAAGLFDVELAPDPGIVNGQALWLEVTVADEPLPRQEILPVPYAMSLVSGASLSGAGADAVLTVINPDGPAIFASNVVTAAGQNLVESSSHQVPPVVVRDNSSYRVGVVGSSHDGTGVLGGSRSGSGVTGNSTSGSGVEGNSISGPGVEGYSKDGTGVYGRSYSGNAGKFDGKVVINGVLNVNGIKLGEDGEIYANSFHGPRSSSLAGSASGTMPLDDYVFSMNSDGSARFASVEADESMAARDVTARDQFKAELLPELGKNLLSTDGLAFLDAIETVIGSWSSKTGNLFTTGDLTAEGVKNAIVSTENSGKRKLYAEEAAEVYFFDRGQGQLREGEVTITLDPVFLETVTIDAEHPMLVQITLTGDCNGVFVAAQTGASFTVRELMGGASAATFNWEVAAKRKGYEDARLEPFTPARERGERHE